MLKDIQQWLKEQPHSNIPRQPCGTSCLTNESVEEIVKAVNELKVCKHCDRLMGALNEPN